MTLVVDASVAVKWLFPETFSDVAARLLRSGHELLAPDLIWTEAASAAHKRVRSGEVLPEKAGEILNDFQRLPIKTYPSKTLLRAAWSASLEAGLSVYDSLYLALSYRRDCSLVTADRKFYDRIHAVYPQSETLWLEDFKA